jgi:hypothetical protein
MDNGAVLIPRSRDIVLRNCHNCGVAKRVEYSNYKRAVARTGKYLCKPCGNVDKKLSVIEARNRFYAVGLIPLFDSYTTNHIKLAYKCPEHAGVTQYKSMINLLKVNTDLGNGCPLCDNVRRSGEGHPNWKGGVSPIHNYLRDFISSWKVDSLRAYDFKCAITGNNHEDLQVHHVFAFKDILEESLKELSLPVALINEYMEHELSALRDLVVKKHYEQGLGVPLRKHLHEEFHSIYGKTKFTSEQFYTFCTEKRALICQSLN